MAISFNDNIKVFAPKPIDAKYLNTSNIPYSAITEVNTTILTSERYIGLTTNINNVEYWYKTGTTNSDLIEKTATADGDGVVFAGTLASGNTLILNRSQGLSDINIDLSSITGATTNDGVVSGATLNGTTLELHRTEGLGDVTVDLTALSGTTSDVYISGATLVGASLKLARTEGLGDVTVDLTPLSGATDLIYSGASPSNIDVGGMSSGTTLTGKTLTEIIEDMAITTYYPTLTSPSNLFIDDATNTQEVGITAGTINFTTNFDQGIILPQYFPTSSDKRSGLPNKYNYTGTGLPTTQASVSLVDIQTINNYVILEGSNQWTNSVSYDIGVQPYDSAENIYNTPLPSGITTIKTTTITGKYIRFWGATASTPITSGNVRSLPNSAFQTSNNNTVTLATGSVLTKFVVVLPPSRTIANVIDLDALNANITSEYAFLGTISVLDGGGVGSSQLYNLYEMNVGSPYGISHSHEITTQ